MLAELTALASMPVLTGEKVTLRGIAAADADELFAVFSDPRAMRHWSEPPHASPAQTEEMIASINRGFEDRSTLQWGVARNPDGRLLGTVTLLTAAEQPRAELGYIIGSEHWGHGYGGEAQRLAVDFAFHALRLHRLDADTDPQNIPSVRSLERLGFRIEGLQRERWLVAGERTDSLMMGLLASEWATASAR
jgi:ribosomal-protein-alanine N-acetyltransferase